MPRWLLLVLDIVALLSLAYAIGLGFWIVAHPAVYNGMPQMPLHLKLWFYNVAVATLGFLWLAVRFSSSPKHRDRYLALDARHPILMRLGPVFVALLGSGMAVWLFSRL